MFYSPLRYPGGKNKLAAFVAKICIDNDLRGHYIEPYAGGASVALFLLFTDVVKKITINDNDKSIYAFWYSVLNFTEELCAKIEETDITVKNWQLQKEIQKDRDNQSLLNIGFSTLFLNRTNISGIINAGMIGGIKQEGKYKLDCRFKKEIIINKIQQIAKLKNQIDLYGIDAIELIDVVRKDQQNKNSIFYFDPPYYLKGNSLYLNHYDKSDHKTVSEKIKQIENIKWIVSYDDVSEIKKLYSRFKKKEYTFKHTAYKAKVGKEILFFSKDLVTPRSPKNWNPINYKMNSVKEIIYSF